MGFPTKNDHFGCFGGTPIFGNTHMSISHDNHPCGGFQTGGRRQNCSLHRMLGGKVADRNSM